MDTPIAKMLRPTDHYSTHRLDEAKKITTLRLANRLVEATLLPNVEENNRTKISKLKCSPTNTHLIANATLGFVLPVSNYLTAILNVVIRAITAVIAVITR